jgi:hypothetical protein
MSRLRLNKWRSPKSQKIYVFINGYEDKSIPKVAIVGLDDHWAISGDKGSQVNKDLARRIFADVEELSGVRPEHGFAALCAAIEW